MTRNILPFEPSWESTDTPEELEREIVLRLAPQPPGNDISQTHQLGWHFAKHYGLAWREDSKSWESMTLLDGVISTTRLTPRDVVRMATVFIAMLVKSGQLFLGKPYHQPNGLSTYSKQVTAQAKIFSIAGCPGENRVEAFLRRSVSDYTEDGLGQKVKCPRHFSVTSGLLLRLYRTGNPHDRRKDGLVYSDIASGMLSLFGAANSHSVTGPNKRDARGYWGVRTIAPNGRRGTAQDASGTGEATQAS